MRQPMRASWRRKETIAGYGFILPWLIGFVIFSVFPIGASLYLSFTKYDILSSPTWIGWDNYRQLFFDDPRYAKSVRVTLTYALIAVPVRLAFALGVAVLLNQKLRMAGFLRSVYYLPTLMGGSVAVIVMWGQIFGINGAFNSGLRLLLGIDSQVSWVTHPSTALYSIVALSTWQFGSSMLIFLAGLKQVPASLLEAAQVDGAGAFRRFRQITLPLLTPVLFFNLVMGVIGALKVFSEAMILTGGGPHDQTLFYAIYLYEASFRFLRMGYGSAMAWLLLLLVAFLTAVLFRSSKYWVYYEQKEGKS